MEQSGTISRAELLIKSLDFSFYDVYLAPCGSLNEYLNLIKLQYNGSFQLPVKLKMTIATI